jgi:hypothetical protein
MLDAYPMKTISTYQHDKSFGPAGSAAGIVILITGTVLLYFSPATILLVLFGTFVAFTNTSTSIDTKNKRIRFSTNLFGLIKIGKWLPLHKEMKVEIMRNNKSFRAYSRGNRELVVKTHAFKAALFGKNNKEIMLVKYFDSLAEGKEFAEELNQLIKK